MTLKLILIITLCAPDLQEMERAYRRSGFSVVGEPRPLGPASPIRAMQATGPAHEVLPPGISLVSFATDSLRSKSVV